MATIRIKRRKVGAGAIAGAPALGGLKNAELAFNEVNDTLFYGKGDDGDGNATSIIPIAGDGVVWTGAQTFGNVVGTGRITSGDGSYAYYNNFPTDPKLLATVDYVDEAIARGSGATLIPLGANADVATTGPLTTLSSESNLAHFEPVRVSFTRLISANGVTPWFNLSGLGVMDGVTLAVNDRVLILSHPLAGYTGIWVVKEGPWVRPADASSAAHFVCGKKVTVQSGTARGGNTYIVPSNAQAATNNDFSQVSNIFFANSTAPAAGYTTLYSRIVRAAGDSYTVVDGKVVVDGVTLNNFDRFLYMPGGVLGGGGSNSDGAASGGTNGAGVPLVSGGIYIVNYTGIGSGGSLILRASDLDSSAEFVEAGTATGANAYKSRVLVLEGATNAKKLISIGCGPDGAGFVLGTSIPTFDVYGDHNAAATGFAGTPIIDGYQTIHADVIGGDSFVVGSSVLVKDETDATLNGLYYIPKPESPYTAANVPWIRHPLADESGELVYGSYIRVLNGNSYKNAGFVQVTNTDPIVPGTTPIVFQSAQAALEFKPGIGLAKSDRTLYVKTASNQRIAVSEAGVDLATVADVVTDGSVDQAYILTQVDQWGRVTANSKETLTATELRGKVVGTPATAESGDTTGTGDLVFSIEPTLQGATIASGYGLKFSNSVSITANGTTSGDATALTNDVNIITASSSGTGVVLPTAAAGRRISILNRSQNTVNVYPASGQVDGLSSYQLPLSSQVEYVSDGSNWFSVAGGGTGSSGLSYTARTANGTLVTLTGSDTYRQVFTSGSTATIVRLPARNTLTVGRSFEIDNNTTADITVATAISGAIFYPLIRAGQMALFTVTSTSGVEIGTTGWQMDFIGGSSATGTNGTLVYAGSPSFETRVTTSSTTFEVFNTTATTVNAFGAATTGNIGYDGTDTSTTNISTGVVAATKTKTVNIGTGATASGSTTAINIGGQDFAGTTNVNIGGGGTVAIGGTQAGKLDVLFDSGYYFRVNSGGKIWLQQPVQLDSAPGGGGTSLTLGFGTGDAGTKHLLKVGQVLIDGSGVLVDSETNTYKGSISSCTWRGDAVEATYGGTGQSTYDTGDLLYASASNTLSKLTKPASATSVLQMTSAGVPSWNSTIGVGLGGTGINTYAVGDILYASSSSALSALAKPAQAAALINDNAGTPSWVNTTGTSNVVRANAPTFANSIDGGTTFAAFATPTTLTIGSTTSTSTNNFATGALTTGTKTVNIGTGATGGTTNVNIGSTAGGTTTINSPTLAVSGLTVSGNLTVNGTTTTINTNTLSVDDKNIELGSVAVSDALTGTISGTSATTTITGLSSTAGLIPGMALTKLVGSGGFGSTPLITSVDSATQITITSGSANTQGVVVFTAGGATDDTADTGGITLKGTTNKTLTWVKSTAAWTSSEDFNLISGKVYEINGTTVLSATALGTNVTSSSLTSVGIIETGTWQGTAVAVGYGGTGTNNGSITGTGALTFTAGGTNTNVTLAPNGTGTVDVSSKRITSLAAPTQDTDAATKAYVDSAVSTGTADGSVTTAKLANGAVTTDKIADDAVTYAKIQEMAATTVLGNATEAQANPTAIAASADGQVLRRSGTTLGFGTIATAGIADSAVTAAKLNSDAVETAKIANNAVTNAKIADGTITATKFAEGAICTAVGSCILDGGNF